MQQVRRIVWVAVLAVIASWPSAQPSAQTPPNQKPVPPAQVQAPPATPAPDYVFPSGAGMIFFYVKPEKTAEFEAIMAKITQALESPQDALRKQQAANWKIFKSAETLKDSAVYVFLFDPAVVGAEYDPVKVLSEAWPAEVQGLYDRLKDAIIRVERMGLTKIR